MADRIIREAGDSDLADVLSIERRAFGGDEEAELVAALLEDPSAAPRLSLIALEDAAPVGHILFTAVTIGDGSQPVGASILAPLAVVPEAQGIGVGGGLVRAGMGRLTERGDQLVFVLGHPTYYPRFGFAPAGRWGLAAPYPLPPASADAWMVAALEGGALGPVRGQVRPAEALARPELWRE